MFAIPLCTPKKYDESQDLWQARVTKGWRFYFKIIGSICRMEELSSHPK